MVYDIYSKRAKRVLGEVGDVYQYSTLPDELKVQIVLLWERFLGRDEKVFGQICRELREEYGCFSLLYLLPGQPASTIEKLTSCDEVIRFFLRTPHIDQGLDVVDACARAFCNIDLDEYYIENLGEWGADVVARHDERKEAFLKALNTRFREAQVGYQFENGQIIRVDDQFIHSEVVKPALHFIRSEGFHGANQEFLDAHRKYRLGDYKGCLVEGAKALESVLKIVLSKRGQDISNTDTAKKLFEKFKALNLLPEYLPGQLNALYDLLQNSSTKPRNKEPAAHGQGAEVREVPEYLAAYGLHQTASAILLIVKAHEAAR